MIREIPDKYKTRYRMLDCGGGLLLLLADCMELIVMTAFW